MQAKYITIKLFIVEQIDTGNWLPTQQILSENELATRFKVSRMTARKAVDALCVEGLLVRSQGLGTFVSDIRPLSSMLEIHNIKDEIQGRGHQYRSKVLDLQQTTSRDTAAMLLGIEQGKVYYRSRIVHFENDIAVQYEDRYVNPDLAPDYINQDFTQQTPNTYLSKVAPLTEADHAIEAILPEDYVAKVLQSDIKSPCLKITRRTWSKHGIVSFAYLIHPGDRYRLGSHLNF